MERGSHPFPSRTRKLSPSSPMVLHGKPCGRVGRRRILLETPDRPAARGFPFSGPWRRAMSKPYDPRDRFYRKARQEGLRARSAYKIEEIDRRFGLFRKGQAV